MLNFNESISLALSWLESNREQFALPPGKVTEDTLTAIKPIGELVLVLSKIQNKSKFNTDRSKLLDWCWAQFRSGDLILDILVARPDLIVLSTIYVSFSQCGYRHKKLDGWIRYISQVDACKSIEFPRWRRLDVMHALSALDNTPLGQDALEGTWISSLPEPWMITEDISYAVTHVIFYVTDFGGNKNILPNLLQNYFENWLPVWMDLCRTNENFDLFSEWLMVAHYIGLESIYQENIGHLLKHQIDDGVFTGPRGSAENLVMHERNISRIYFLRNYHTTLVSILALLPGT